MTDTAISVFLSYSRKDSAICEKLHSNLELQGLDVKIDVEDIPIGESIKDTIARLIANSACSVIVISENSLQSFWVIWEIQQRQELTNTKLIPVYLDKNYLDDPFVNNIQEKVQTEIEQLANDALVLSRHGTPSIHLDNKKNLLLDFKHNFSKVLEYIRSTNSVDLRTENYLAGFNALYKAITNKATIENPNIITPPLFKNVDISSRMNEIEFLVAEANIKEAAKRLIDFVNDFYPKNINFRRTAIKISAKAHDGEKNLSKGDELMANHDKLIDEILDLIYSPLLAEAA